MNKRTRITVTCTANQWVQLLNAAGNTLNFPDQVDALFPKRSHSNAAYKCATKIRRALSAALRGEDE